MCSVAINIIFSAIFQQIVIKESVADFVFIKMPCFEHVATSEYLKMVASEVWKSFFETHLVLDIQTTLVLQNPHCKNFWWNYNKNENCKPCWGNKEKNIASSCFSIRHAHWA